MVSCLALPSSVIACMFLIGALNVNAYLPIYGTTVVLILAIGTRYLATAFKITQDVFRQVDFELMNAARGFGIPGGITLTGIMVPMLRSSLVFAWFRVALLTLRELPITPILSTYELQTLASRIFLHNSSGETRQAAAPSLALFFIVSVFLVGFFRFIRVARAPGPQSMTGIVTLSDIRKTFRSETGAGVEVLHGIDLRIAQGQCMVLLGPSGCGKTTTLRIIAGLEVPSDGAVTLDGMPVHASHPARWVRPEDRRSGSFSSPTRSGRI